MLFLDSCVQIFITCLAGEAHLPGRRSQGVVALLGGAPLSHLHRRRRQGTVHTIILYSHSKLTSSLQIQLSRVGLLYSWHDDASRYTVKPPSARALQARNCFNRFNRI